jgi:ceramide glucosyltransferase
MDTVELLLFVCGISGIAYLAAAVLAVRRFLSATVAVPSVAPPAATILKPLHGEDAGLYGNLRSFCEQDYPAFQIVCGVRDRNDPAAAVVRRVASDVPKADLFLIADPRVFGTNLKVSNLENMLPKARHDVLVIADSDMRVGANYLTDVTAPLADREVGVVTCLYNGRSTGGLWSTLGAMFINHTFLPFAMVGSWVKPADACFGATMALRRDTLDAIGGFSSVHNRLADDYELGMAIRRAGRRIVLSRHIVCNIVSEPSLKALFAHELRWARTIRAIAPIGYAASVVTHPLVVAWLATALSGFDDEFLIAAGIITACRLAFARWTEKVLGVEPSPLWLVPARDLLTFAVFVASFLGRSVQWRGNSFRVDGDGHLIPIKDTQRDEDAFPTTAIVRRLRRRRRVALSGAARDPVVLVSDVARPAGSAGAGESTGRCAAGGHRHGRGPVADGRL